MNSNKRYIKIIIIVVLLPLIFLFFIGKEIINNKKNDYIVLEDSFTFYNQGNNWLSYTAQKSVNWQLFKVYVDHKNMGKNYLYYNKKMYLFNKKKQAINYTGSLIAFSNSNYKDTDFSIVNSSDNTYLNELLKENNIDINQELTSNNYIDIDIDNDNTLERIYVVSNRFPMDNIDTSIYFSFVFLVKDNKIIVMYKDIQKTTDSYAGCKPYIRNIISNGKKNNKSIILSCAYYSTSKIDSNLYIYKDAKFKRIT